MRTQLTYRLGKRVVVKEPDDTSGMYGVLRGDGTVEQLPGVVAGCIQNERLICYDASERILAIFPANGVMFGDAEALERIARRLSRLEAYRRLERLAERR